MTTEELFAQVANFALESQRIGAGAVKDFKYDVTVLPQLRRFLNTLTIPITATAVGGDLIHVEITPSVNPEVKAGGITA